jgi:uncharacterized membrane protein
MNSPNSIRRITSCAAAALTRLLASGRQLILVTGRELEDLRAVFAHLNIFERVVAENGALLYRGIGGHCYVYQAVGINTAERGRRPLVSVPYNQGIRVEKTVTIAKSPEALYRFWRNFENLPRFMENLVSVTPRSDKVSHRVAKAPAGTTVEWDAEIINDQENQWIAWRSLPNADVDHAGSVRFRPAPGGRGTDSRSTWGKGSLGRALRGFPSYTPRIATIVSPLGLTFTRNNMDSIFLYYQKTSAWTKA